MDFTVRIPPRDAAKIVTDEFLNSSLSGHLVDQYHISSSQGECVVIILEKYFMRNSSRASLTVVIDNFSEITRVHAVGSGGGQGAIFKFDWGSGNSLEGNVANALRQYM